jgi:hypothetical protein
MESGFRISDVDIEKPTAPSAAWVSLASCASSHLSALADNTFYQSASSVSHLRSASRQRIRDILVLSLQISVDLLLMCTLCALTVSSLLAVSPECSLLGNPLGFCFSRGVPFWTHGWGVSGLSVVLERSLS